MCYCKPNIRTPFCTNCQYVMYDDIKKLKLKLEKYESAFKPEDITCEAIVQYHVGTKIPALFSINAVPENMIGKKYIVTLKEQI